MKHGGGASCVDVVNSEEIPNADIDTFEAEKERKKNCIALLTYVERTDSLLNLHSAERYWIRFIQQSEFEKDLLKLTRKESLSSDSKLYGISPILTAGGRICFGDRLQHSDFQFQEKHPWIIPKKSRFTELLIKREHENLLHAGVSDTLTQTLENYWIIRGRQAVKSCLNNCIVCRKFKAEKGTQVIASLPADRIHEANPFEITAVDFAGPLFIKNGYKVYICLFTCAVTRAVHLEIVSSLSTEHFILAFRRFVTRRGVCRTIYSDNDKTLKGADVELKKLYVTIVDPPVQNYFFIKRMRLHFVVERAAWWGGYWERMVKMTKGILRKLLGKASVSFEELQTILTEIESVLNSRPLNYVYNDPSEPFPLTPTHFLTGKRLTSLPHQAGHVKEHIAILIGDDKLPRQLWKLGKVMELHRGRDNK
ncbi:uncharacterized protein LOC118199947, partial [Stegodyphus dumicola]|uniref:uncharacterized protein LOC118199947 n=1 Tax=Stegodyphus dumicola TaxID=202533 RepID=UPI0015AE193C